MDKRLFESLYYGNESDGTEESSFDLEALKDQFMAEKDYDAQGPVVHDGCNIIYQILKYNEYKMNQIAKERFPERDIRIEFNIESGNDSAPYYNYIKSGLYSGQYQIEVKIIEKIKGRLNYLTKNDPILLSMEEESIDKMVDIIVDKIADYVEKTEDGYVWKDPENMPEELRIYLPAEQRVISNSDLQSCLEDLFDEVIEPYINWYNE